MATSGLSFGAQVEAWVQETDQRMTAVFRDSTQELVSIMQEPVGSGGNTPVDTGFMRATVQASTSDMPSIDPRARPASDAEPGSYPYVSAPVSLVIAGAKLGQTIYVGYTAAYAAIQENRRGFVRLAALQWQSIVDRSIAKAKARAR